jgi:hypothetical protein
MAGVMVVVMAAGTGAAVTVTEAATASAMFISAADITAVRGRSRMRAAGMAPQVSARFATRRCGLQTFAMR